MPRGIGQEDPDLGVLDPPGGAGVLAGDAGGMGPLLEEAGLVEDQHGVGVAEGLDDVGPEVVADRVGVPFGAAHQVLDAVGGGVADLLGELPGVLALDRPEQAGEIGAGAVPGLAAREPRPDPASDRVEFTSPITNVLESDDGTDAGHGDPPWAIPWPDYRSQFLVTTVVLSDPVLEYLPSTVKNSNLGAVTLQDLATHTSQLQDSQFQGLGHISDQLFTDRRPSDCLVEGWNRWANGCCSAIGAHWQYSNVGFVTLGFAVVGRNGPPDGPGYDELLRAQITGEAALRMPLTVPGSQIPPKAVVAQGYVRNKEKQPTPVDTLASDLYSTSRDMLTWLKANLGVLDHVPATLAAALRMTHGNPAANGAPYFGGWKNADCRGNADELAFDMGLAWQISHDQPSIWAKDGLTSLGGGSSWIGFIPADSRPGDGAGHPGQPRRVGAPQCRRVDDAELAHLRSGLGPHSTPTRWRPRDTRAGYWLGEGLDHDHQPATTN